MRFKILIVDDESAGRTLLIHQSKKVFGEKIAVLEAAENLESAKKKLISQLFDICFLDIQLSQNNGFDLLPFISPTTKVVFVTAYSEYAIQAIKAKAYDYILKPLDPKEFQFTVLKLMNDAKSDLKLNTYLTLKDSGESVPIMISDIEYIEARGAYSCIYLNNAKTFTTSKTLKSLSPSLGDGFIRIHKSYLVNRAFVKSFTKDHLTTTKSTCLPVSRLGARELSRIF